MSRWGAQYLATGSVDRFVLPIDKPRSTYAGPQYELLTFVASGNLTVTNNSTTSVSIFKTSGSASWDNQAYVSTGYTAPVTVEFNKSSPTSDNGTGYSMISLNADPTTDANYTSLDWAAYPYATSGGYYVYHNGSSITPSSTSYNSSLKWYIVYATDGFIYHYNGSNLMYSVNKGTGQTVYLDSSFYSVDATNGGFSNIRMIKRAWNGTTYV